jgi:hypothetical protein
MPCRGIPGIALDMLLQTLPKQGRTRPQVGNIPAFFLDKINTLC